MSTTRFAFFCTLLLGVMFALSALGVGIVALGVLGGLAVVLRDHRKLYFRLQPLGWFSVVAYGVAVVFMAWTTVAVGLKIYHGIGGTWIPWECPLPDPLAKDYGLHAALGSLFLLWALKPADPHAQPMTFTGAVVWDQWELLLQSPRVIAESLKRSFRIIVEEHWLKGLAGLALLIISIPVGLISFLTGALAVLWVAVIWNGLTLLVVLPLVAGHRLIHRKGLTKTCPGCGQAHRIPGPGPLGLLSLRCRCGQKVGLWNRQGMTDSPTDIPSPLPWLERPCQRGALPLLILGLVMVGVMGWRALGF